MTQVFIFKVETKILQRKIISQIVVVASHLKDAELWAAKEAEKRYRLGPVTVEYKDSFVVDYTVTGDTYLGEE